MNHPFPKGWTLLHNFDFRKIKLLEICNAPHLLTKEINNEKAVRFFDYLWNHGHYVYGTGGSDAHKKNYFDTYPVGIPSVKTYCEGLSIQHVLNAIKQGHIIVQKEILLEVEFKNQDSIVLPGDRVNGAVSLVARANKNVTWELIKNGELQIQSEGDFFKSEVYVNENEFYRIQAKVNDEIVGFINPIHNMTKAPNEIEFQKLLQDFEEKDMGK